MNGIRGVTVELEEGERQAVLLALAKLLIERPGWDVFIGEIATKLRGHDMLREFMAIHSDGGAPNGAIDFGSAVDAVRAFILDEPKQRGGVDGARDRALILLGTVTGALLAAGASAAEVRSLADAFAARMHVEAPAEKGGRN